MALGNVLIVGAHWMLRQGLKDTLKRLDLVIVGEGDELDDAWGSNPGMTKPNIVLVIAGQAGQFETALDAACEAKRKFITAKVAIWSETASGENVSAAIRAGADALLSSTLSSRFLGNSLQLVLLGHKLFPTLPAQDSDDEHAAMDEPAGRPVPMLPLVPSTLPAPLPVSADHSPPPASCVIKLEDHVFPNRPQDPVAGLAWSNGRPGPRGAQPSTVPSDREWEILRCLSSGKPNKAIARELNIAETTVKVHIKSLLRKLSVSNRTQAAIWALNHGDGAAPDVKPLLLPAQLHSK